MPTIVSIAWTPEGIDPKPVDHYARIPAAAAHLVTDRGIDGDRKGRSADRHLNVMTRDILDGLTADGCRTGPGEMGEQIVVAGIDVSLLTPGTRIRLGPEAVIEVVKPRTGCSRLAHIQKIELKATRNRLGQICRVERGGPIRIGDAVEVLADDVPANASA